MKKKLNIILEKKFIMMMIINKKDQKEMKYYGYTVLIIINNTIKKKLSRRKDICAFVVFLIFSLCFLIINILCVSVGFLFSPFLPSLNEKSN